MNQKYYFSSFLVACLAVSPLARADNTPAFHAAPFLTPAQISAVTLPNGVRGIVKSGGASGLVNIQVWVRAGSRYEFSNENGAAHLVEVAALRGSKNYPAAAGGDDSGGALGAIRALGGDGGSLTSRDSTFYSASVAAPYAAQAIKILADAVLRPDLSAAAMEDVKSQADDDIANHSFDAVSLASDLAYSTAYAKHPYRRPALGSDSVVAAMSAATVHAFYAKHYVGANMSVVVAGQIPAQSAQTLIAQNFAVASQKSPMALKLASEAPLKADTVAQRRLVTREVIDLAWRSPGITDPKDCVATDTLLSLWREGLNANLRKLLMRDGEGSAQPPLVASYDVDFLTQRDPGLFIVSLVDPQDREGAVEAVLNEVKRVRDNGISAQELARAKAQLRDQYIEQGETVSGQAGSLGFYSVIDSHRFAVNYLDMCSHVTAADVQRIAKKYLSPTTFVRTEIVPLPRPRPQQDDNSPVITASWNGATSP